MDTAFSVVIPSYNSRRTIGRSLASLASQTRGDLVREVIVVDSSTEEASRVELDALAGGRTRVVRAGQRTMPAVARNLGAAEASGDTLVFLDSDAYFAEDAIEVIARHRARGVRVGGGSISLPPFQKGSRLAAAQFFLQFNEFMPEMPERLCRFTPSCNLFCERALFQKIGGFPVIRASEDVLFGEKASRETAFRFLPDVRAFHIFRQEWRSYLENQALLGRYIAVYRSLKEPKRPLYRRGFRAALLPAVLTVKWMRISARVASRPSALPAYVSALPHFLLGLAYWGKGFAASTEGLS